MNGNVFIAPPTQGRSDYMRVVDQLAATFNTSAEAFIRQYKVYDDILKLPQLLIPNQSLYTFNPVKAVDTPVPGENKIDKNDFFAVTGVGIRFTQATYTSSTGATSAWGNYPEYTWPYDDVFSAAGEASALMTIVRGILALSVTNDQQWALPVSEMVFEQQFINAQPTTQVYGGNDGQRGIRDLNSIVILDGGADNILSLALLQGTTTNIDANTTENRRNYVMPILRGIHIKNLAGGGFSLASCRL